MMVRRFFGKKACKFLFCESKVGEIFGRILIPSPGGVIYVRRTFARTLPSRTMPTPILLALPSKPIEITIFLLYLLLQNWSKKVNRHVKN